MRLRYKSLATKATATTGKNTKTSQQYKTLWNSVVSQSVKHKETTAKRWWSNAADSAKNLVESAIQKASGFYQDHKVGINIAIGAAAIIGAGVLTVVTAGSAAPVIALAAKLAFVGSIAGGTAGAVVGGVSASVSGKNVGEAVAEGFGSGALTGAVSGALAATPVGRVGQMVGNAAISTSSYATQTTLNGGQISAAGLGIAAAGGVIAGAIGGPGATSAGQPYKEVVDYATQSIVREARRSNVEYAAKQIIRTTEYLAEKTVEVVVNTTGSIVKGSIMGSFAGTVAGST